MTDIYRKAQRVVIWLGPEADKSALAMKAIEYTGSQIQIKPKLRTWRPVQNADPKFSRESQEIPHSQRELEAIQKLVARSWFKRLWVRQEVTLAREAVVIAGNCTVSWTHLISAGAFLDTFIRLRQNSDPAFRRDLLNLVEFGFIKSYEDIIDIFHACRAYKCTEDHNRVYTLLGFLSSERSLTIQPDYSKRAKNVYQNLIIQCYHHYQRLNILTLYKEAETPSWVPDLQKLHLNTDLNTKVAQYCQASSKTAAALILSTDNTIETFGVKCGILGRNISSPIDKNNESRVLKHAIVQIVRDHMGADASRWDDSRLEILTKGLLGCIWFERTRRKNHSRLSLALLELKKWAMEEPNKLLDHLPDRHDSLVLVNHIARAIFQGDSCRWTQDGHLGLGYSACQEGDVLYAILGCRRLMVLRKEPVGERYRVVGKFDHPGYNDGEALLGKLAAGWKASYKHLLLASNRPKFEHEDGSSQWQDPRLQDMALPEGWHEGRDQDGYSLWFRTGTGNECSYSDPRLTFGELKKRGIKVERLVIL